MTYNLKEIQKFLDAQNKISKSDKQKLASGKYKVITKTTVSQDGWKITKGVVVPKDKDLQM